MEISLVVSGVALILSIISIYLSHFYNPKPFFHVYSSGHSRTRKASGIHVLESTGKVIIINTGKTPLMVMGLRIRPEVMSIPVIPGSKYPKTQYRKKRLKQIQRAKKDSETLNFSGFDIPFDFTVTDSNDNECDVVQIPPQTSKTLKYSTKLSLDIKKYNRYKKKTPLTGIVFMMDVLEGQKKETKRIELVDETVKKHYSKGSFFEEK